MGEQSGPKMMHLGDSFNTWVRYCEGTEALVHLTHDGLANTINLPEIYRIIGMEDARITQAEWKAEQAKKEIDAGFATLHAHSLLGLWGALECLIEDIFKASIRADMSLLTSSAFSKIKLPLDILFGPDGAREEAVLLELVRSTSSEKSVGITQFERILNPIGLGGEVPMKIKDAVFRAQQIRHVWAHRGGIADAAFVARCPDRAQIGDKLTMDSTEFLHLMHGLHMYGWVIANRHLRSIGEKQVAVACHGYKDVSPVAPEEPEAAG